MTDPHDGKDLIFLASQPRAGSTLLQRMLGAHREVYTVSEPWLMLPATYALRQVGHTAEYDATLAARAIDIFLSDTGLGRQEYWRAAREMYGRLYRRARERHGASRFLDKTPRYYLAIDEILSVFPRASLIVLVRHPLAVLLSFAREWRSNPGVFDQHRLDLLEAPRLLARTLSRKRQETLLVHFEQLVEQPEATLRNICDQIGLQYLPEMLDYATESPHRWRLGNQDTVYENRAPAAGIALRWRQELAIPQRWRLARGYLESLGSEVFGSLGYSFGEATELLERHKPPILRRRLTVSLSHAMRISSGYAVARRTIPRRRRC